MARFMDSTLQYLPIYEAYVRKWKPYGNILDILFIFLSLLDTFPAGTFQRIVGKEKVTSFLRLLA
jgi:hypothetical protein